MDMDEDGARLNIAMGMDLKENICIMLQQKVEIKLSDRFLWLGLGIRRYR